MAIDRICEHCSERQAPGAHFCASCGKPLARICPICMKEASEQARFCVHCGAPLGRDIEGAWPRREDDAGQESELVSVAERYELRSLLGEGSSKRVYMARDTLLDRDVAFAQMKVDELDDLAFKRIRREAQAMGRLGTHPHIVSVFDVGMHRGRPYIVTELMPGGDLTKLLGGSE